MSENKYDEVRFSKMKFIRLKELSFSVKSHPHCLGLKFISSYDESKQEGRKSFPRPNRVGTVCQPLLSIFVYVFSLPWDNPKPETTVPKCLGGLSICAPLNHKKTGYPFGNILRALQCSSSLCSHINTCKNFSPKEIIRNTLKEACHKNLSW